jgi:hypothetical protein
MLEIREHGCLCPTQRPMETHMIHKLELANKKGLQTDLYQVHRRKSFDGLFAIFVHMISHFWWREMDYYYLGQIFNIPII